MTHLTSENWIFTDILRVSMGDGQMPSHRSKFKWFYLLRDQVPQLSDWLAILYVSLFSNMFNNVLRKGLFSGNPCLNVWWLVSTGKFCFTCFSLSLYIFMYIYVYIYIYIYIHTHKGTSPDGVLVCNPRRDHQQCSQSLVVKLQTINLSLDRV